MPIIVNKYRFINRCFTSSIVSGVILFSVHSAHLSHQIKHSFICSSIDIFFERGERIEVIKWLETDRPIDRAIAIIPSRLASHTPPARVRYIGLSGTGWSRVQFSERMTGTSRDYFLVGLIRPLIRHGTTEPSVVWRTRRWSKSTILAGRWSLDGQSTPPKTLTLDATGWDMRRAGRSDDAGEEAYICKAFSLLAPPHGQSSD